MTEPSPARGYAMAITTYGWRIVAGTYPVGDHWYGRDNAHDLCPIDDNWANSPGLTRAQVTALWSAAPYSPLLVCAPVNAIDIPVTHPAIPWGDLEAPIATVDLPPPHHSRRLVFVGPGPLRADLAAAGVVALRGPGDWVALPPTRGVRWLREPRSTGRVPDSTQVQARIAMALAPTH